jgi:hypothetical protein
MKGQLGNCLSYVYVCPCSRTPVKDNRRPAHTTPSRTAIVRLQPAQIRRTLISNSATKHTQTPQFSYRSGGHPSPGYCYHHRRYGNQESRNTCQRKRQSVTLSVHQDEQRHRHRREQKTWKAEMRRFVDCRNQSS